MEHQIIFVEKYKITYCETKIITITQQNKSPYLVKNHLLKK